jgi:predicted phage terminase large subunit-like protein
MTSINESKPEDQKKIRWLLQNDRQFFFEYLLPHYIKTPEKPVGDLHAKWFHALETERKFGAIAPREHAKSTIITVADNLFDICNGYEPYILIFSDTPEQAIEHLGNIVEELEGNEKLIKWYGKLYEARRVGEKKKEKWTASTIVTRNNVKVVANGWRFKSRGLRKKDVRPTKITIDDIENDQDSQSPVMRNKLKRTFERKILNLGSRETKYRFVGTILHFDSLLMNEYQNPRKGWKWIFDKAIQDDGTPLWPEWWNLERLQDKKHEIGSIPFEQEFMNNPLDPETQIFFPKEYYEGSVDLTMVDCYGYIDLAISEKETADYTAIVTIGKHKQTGKLYVIEPVRLRGDITTQLNLVFDMHKKYKYKSFGVESVAYQKAFYQIVTTESQKRGIYIPVVECEVDKDKVRRAVEITPHVENGTVIFNASFQDFMAELVQFPKAAHDDFVDAFVGAVKLATKGSSSGRMIKRERTSAIWKDYKV